MRSLPRLSIDIDLTYLPLSDRNKALCDITERLLRVSQVIERVVAGVQTIPVSLDESNHLKGLVVRRENAQIRIEPNLVMRGSAYPPQTLRLCQKAKELFERAIDVQAVSFADLYGGKICAALDRQHPRDLFDVKLLLENEGLTDEIRKAFIVYLISHQRPMVEILDPGLLNLQDSFNLEFKGMTAQPVTLDELTSVRASLIKLLRQSLTLRERRFIVSVKNKNPKWELLGVDHIEDLPAVKWKLLNINRMDVEKHKKALQKLRDYLEI